MDLKAHLAYNSIIFSKMDFPRRQAIAYTVNVVVFWRRCKMESLLLRRVVVVVGGDIWLTE